MRRSREPEILDRGGIPEDQVALAYREVTRLHRLLGDTHAIVRAIRRDPLPVRRVLDIGCAHGGVSRDVQRALGVEVIGVDLSPPQRGKEPPRLIAANAACDALPEADVAFSMHTGHHLEEAELVALIRNVGRSCRRFLLMDLVRHPLPLALFSLFVAPFVSPITAADGRLSIRRACSSEELREIVSRAVITSGASFRHSVAPFWIRQLVDIRYR